MAIRGTATVEDAWFGILAQSESIEDVFLVHRGGSKQRQQAALFRGWFS